MTTQAWDTEQAPALQVEGLHKAFGQQQVLSDLDLSVRPGEVLGMLGPNGVGKSTLAAVLSGAVSSDAGHVQINGTDWSADRVSLIEQELRLDPDLTVAETMLRFTDPATLGEDPNGLVRKALVDMGLPLLPTDRIADLSETERRLVEIARLAVDAREVVVIDEVSATLNAREIEDLRYVLRKATDEDRAVIYITHRMNEALELCDRAAVLREGQITDVFNTLTTTPAILAEAMFDRQPNLIREQSNVGADIALSVRGMQLGDNEISFDVRAGEVVGLCGARDSGVSQILGALTGEQPLVVDELTIAGVQTQIGSTKDATVERIAVLSSATDPDSEKRFARNMMMLNEHQGSNFDSELEQFAEVLLAIRQSEEAGSRLLDLPPMSMGQRRWRQLREIAAEQARILVLIEPDQGLDLEAKEHFLGLIDEVTARGVAVLLASSDESLVHNVSDRILVIDQGDLVAQWDPAQVSVADLEAVSRGDFPAEASAAK